MSSSMVEIQVTNATAVEVTDDRLSVELDDGRTISVPLGWYPRLLHATQTSSPGDDPRRVRHRSRSGYSIEKSEPNVRSAPPERINPNST